MGVLLLTQSVWFLLDCITLCFWLQLQIRLDCWWKPAFMRLLVRRDEEASSHLAWFLSLSQVWYFFLPKKGMCLIIKPTTYHKKQMGLQMQFSESSGHERYSSLISNRLQKAFAQDREEQLICFTFEGVNLLLVLQCSLLWFL